MHRFDNGGHSFFEKILPLHSINGKISFSHCFGVCSADKAELYFYWLGGLEEEANIERISGEVGVNNSGKIEGKKIITELF